LRALLVAALLILGVGGTIDLILDQPTSLFSFHVLFELALIASAVGIAVALWLGWRRAEASASRLRRTLEERDAERERWRTESADAVAQFAQAVEQQFTAWGLTPTEREVAFLLLEGHGHKQIAARSGRAERTVRQHAVSVYQKSGLGGRAVLAGFFLGGLLPRGG
jgi:DNA-binding CsgD family transcriptional regulator